MTMQPESPLQKQLQNLAAARTPLHMPGHKRRICPARAGLRRVGYDRN